MSLLTFENDSFTFLWLETVTFNKCNLLPQLSENVNAIRKANVIFLLILTYRLIYNNQAQFLENLKIHICWLIWVISLITSIPSAIYNLIFFFVYICFTRLYRYGHSSCISMNLQITRIEISNWKYAQWRDVNFAKNHISQKKNVFVHTRWFFQFSIRKVYFTELQ